MTRDQHDKELLKTLQSISASLKHADKHLEKINFTLMKLNSNIKEYCHNGASEKENENANE